MNYKNITNKIWANTISNVGMNKALHDSRTRVHVCSFVDLMLTVSVVQSFLANKFIAISYNIQFADVKDNEA